MIIGGVGSEGPGEGSSDVEEGAKRFPAMFLMRSWSFLEMYSKIDLGAEGRGVSPSAAPRYPACKYVRSVGDNLSNLVRRYACFPLGVRLSL